MLNKTYPIITNLYILACMIMVWVGFPIHNYLYTTLGYAIIPTIIFTIQSVAFKFCVWHRLLLINMIIVSICEFVVVNFESLYDGKCYLITIAAITSLMSFISVFLRYKHGCFKTSFKKGARNAR